MSVCGFVIIKSRNTCIYFYSHTDYKLQNSDTFKPSINTNKVILNVITYAPVNEALPMSRLLHKDKDKDDYESPNPRRTHTIMSPEEVAAGKRSFWPELEITGPIRNLSPALWRMSHLTSLYLNDNNLSRIPPDISRLTCLIHLDLSCNKLRGLPAELGDLVLLRELLLNNNFLRVLPYELGKLFQLNKLGLKGNPLSHELYTRYTKPNGTQELLAFLLDNLPVTQLHPPQRPWIPLALPDRQKPTCIFTVMCYNILCPKYATRQLYGYCPSWALSWEYRRKGIMEEIRHYSADIISLQEVETDQFYNFFLPELKNEGYDGIFSPKSRAKIVLESERKHVDGCAIFFRSDKFSLIKDHLVEFNQLAMANAEGSDDMLNRVQTKDNIGLTALLQTREGAFENGAADASQIHQPLLVCTAHLHWDPEFSDVKIIQTMMLMNELQSIVEEASQSFYPGCQRSDANNIPLLLCGDFNSLPGSGVVEFLSLGRVSVDHVDFKKLGYKDCLRKLSSTDKTNEYTHDFKLSRAYKDDIMSYTNYTYDFKGIIDYIFYSKKHITVLGLLGSLDQEWIKENKIAGCPHPHIPSDHFPLLVELEMTLPTSSPMLLNGLMLNR
ncbi:CCR4-NOT transcription complex subunit 6-like isoform X2 [Tachypleus tridentatus]|uniref:CCR4-NOT transcription complex subunit 6-like isoform X2 n=1 Tax=Tachypleus tridentatus TaxID=6853 RepID=UPI003FD4BCE5